MRCCIFLGLMARRLMPRQGQAGFRTKFVLAVAWPAWHQQTGF
jgi:hypothetical protein